MLYLLLILCLLMLATSHRLAVAGQQYNYCGAGERAGLLWSNKSYEVTDFAERSAVYTTKSQTLQSGGSMDKTLMERVSLIDGLTKEEQSTIFSILDAFVAKRKLKSTLKTVLQDME